jgi:hypothetical protein
MSDLETLWGLTLGVKVYPQEDYGFCFGGGVAPAFAWQWLSNLLSACTFPTRKQSEASKCDSIRVIAEGSKIEANCGVWPYSPWEMVEHTLQSLVYCHKAGKVKKAPCKSPLRIELMYSF